MAKESANEETTLLQDPREDSEDDEALSLCDLPLSNAISPMSSSRWGKDDEEDDFFEFFSEEFTSSSTSTAENIIFCGKLIPYNKDPPQRYSNPQSIRRSNSLHNSKAVMSGSDGGKGNFTTTPLEYPSIGKVSLMRSTTKSRWFLFMFGMSGLSSTTNTAAMELGDIRTRQSRSRRAPRSAATMFAKEEEAKRKECKGLWRRVLRSISVGLGCRSTRLANDVVKAAFV